MPRTKLTEGDIVAYMDNDHALIRFNSLEGYEIHWDIVAAKKLVKQILEDAQIMDEFEQGPKNIQAYMYENKISRSKLIAEILLLNNENKQLKQKLEEIKEFINFMPKWGDNKIAEEYKKIRKELKEILGENNEPV